MYNQNEIEPVEFQDEGALFDLEAVKMDSPRLVELKKYDIQTHFSEDEFEPWIAIPMAAARERLVGWARRVGVEGKITDLTATGGAILDEEGMVFSGQTEVEVQNAALDFMRGREVFL